MNRGLRFRFDSAFEIDPQVSPSWDEKRRDPRPMTRYCLTRIWQVSPLHSHTR